MGTFCDQIYAARPRDCLRVEPMSRSGSAFFEQFFSNSALSIEPPAISFYQTHMQFLSLLLYSQLSWSMHPSFNFKFQKVSGQPTSVQDLGVSEGQCSYLVLFWANWCAPCKAELEMVTKFNAETLKIVAVNVDEQDDVAAAKSFMQKINWPHEQLYDEGGRHFYAIRLTGELPYSLWMDPNGQLKKSIIHLKQKDLEQLESDSCQIMASEQTPWKYSLDIQYRSNNENREFRTLGTTHNLGYFGKNYSSSIGYKLLAQNLETEALYEDELADSYFEYFTKSAKFRIGDDYINWNGGTFLSARKIPLTQEDFSLLGLHYHYTKESWELSAIAGRIRNSLYGMEIDPRNDASIGIPDLHTAAVKMALRGDAANEYAVELYAGQLERKKAINLGYAQQTDTRFGTRLFYRVAPYGIELIHNSFNIKEHVEAPNYREPHVDQINLWAWVPLTYLRYRSVPDRVLVPTLIEQPGFIIESKQVEVFRINPQFSVGRSEWLLSAISEKSLVPDEEIDQLTTSIGVSLPTGNFKSTLMNQTRNEAEKKNQEWFLVLGAEFSEHFSGQTTLRQNESNASNAGDGQSYQFILGYSLPTKWIQSFAKPGTRILLELNSTHQNGEYYRNLSRLDKNTLNSFSVQWNWNFLSTRIAIGEAPGGFICANGICAERPPLNGVKWDLGYTVFY